MLKGQNPQRIRMEFRLRRGLDAAGQERLTFSLDKKLSALRVLLTERFGVPGAIVFKHWLSTTASDRGWVEIEDGVAPHQVLVK